MRVHAARLLPFLVAVLLVGGALGAIRVAAAHEAAARRARAVAAAERARLQSLRPTSLAPMVGYWVWWKLVERDAVVRTLTFADMVRRVGPLGWPGCPEHIVCTRYGSRTLAVGPHGEMHFVANVRTSSDLQSAGDLTFVAPGLARFDRASRFSCAHPGNTVTTAESTWLRFRADADADTLTLGVTDFEALEPFPHEAPTAEPERWITFRRVTRAQFYDSWLIRRCQPAPGAACEPACFSDDLVGDR